MKKRTRTLWHWLAVCAMALAATASPAARRTHQHAAGVDPALVRRLLEQGEVPGLAMAVISRGRVRQVSAFGVKNASTRQRVDARTVFEAASLSKPVTAYAVLKLVDAGRIKLDRPAADYVDGGVLDSDPRWRRITIRMLLSHSSGLPNELFESQTVSIAFEPGSRFSYSGVGYSVLQSVIENVTGQRFEAVVERSVFRPLRMSDSSFVWRPAYESRKASGHNSVGVPNEIRRPDAAKAPSGLHTTAGDYARFLRAVLVGTGLSKESWRAMATIQTPVPRACVVCFGKPAGAWHKAIGWGLGWGIERSGARRLLFHWGENNGDFQAFVMGDPATQSGIVVLTNSGNGLSIVPALVAATFTEPHPAFAWMGYDRYDSPARLAQRRILEIGAAKALSEIAASGQPTLSETQWNRIGYQLLGRGRPGDALRIFAFNAKAFPRSANAYDSLGEAYLATGDKAAALANYQRSLELDPANENARQAIAKLKQEPPE